MLAREMPKLTLNRVFALSLAGLLAGLALLFWLVFTGLQTALLRSAQQSRDRDSAVIAASVTDYLRQAPAAAGNFVSLVRAGLTKPSDPQSLRDGLLDVLIRNKDISEATFTYAKSSGFDARGRSIIDPATVGQVDIYRTRQGGGFVHRTTWYQGGRFLSTHAHLYLDGHEAPAEGPFKAANPADHPTFIGPTLHRLYGRLLWTDLHWFAVDADLPESRRRVEVSVQKAIEAPPGHLAGVLRIGLFKDAIDRAIAMPPAVDTKTHAIFLCDSDGRLIALSGSTSYIVSGDDIRLSPAGAPPQVLAALQRPALRTVGPDRPVVPDQFVTSGTIFLCTFRSLPHTQSWIVGMAVPRRVYLKALLKTRRQVVWGSFALAAAIGLLGGLVLRAVAVAHSVILREAARMNDFVLDPSKNSCRFHDINHVLASLERAKTAMRSMGKYVPMDLVRRLYHRGEEPRLGGEATEISALFTDIQGFTDFAEAADADKVANHLGAYLQVMVSVIQGEKGTIDKFIGDSVMAFWNAPEPVPDNATLACRAVLGCREALAALYASPQWEGAPGFVTRFGLHHCVASVGHFGSPERFNYTAIGDGINLASRLERLNKHYGTSVIASAGLRNAAAPGFLFRHLDRVAVKGKTECLDIYELIGDSATPLPDHVAVYEQALEAWFKGDFERALALAESEPGDPPSAFLAARCRLFIATPPVEWHGVYAFETK
jgi:adenylate cyclase